jgi:protein SCO1
MTDKQNTRLFIALVFLVPIALYLAFCVFGLELKPLPMVRQLNIGKTAEKAPTDEFHLINQNDKPASISDWKNKIVVVNFFFTHCPVVCPMMTDNMKTLQTNFAGDEGLLINSISVDPERDSAAQLRWYAEKFQLDLRNWQLLTGDKKEIYRMARNSFKLAATDGDGGPTDFIHSEQFVLIDRYQRIRGYYKGTDDKEVARLIHDIKKLKNEKD